MMKNNSVQTVAAQKAKMAKILFWVFLIIFCITSAFAFLGLAIVFINPERAEQFPFFKNLVWAMWGAVLAQVALGIFALWKNLFNLSVEQDVSNVSNVVSEIINGLEANDKIPEDIAEGLREQYSEFIGTESNVL